MELRIENAKQMKAKKSCGEVKRWFLQGRNTRGWHTWITLKTTGFESPPLWAGVIVIWFDWRVKVSKWICSEGYLRNSVLSFLGHEVESWVPLYDLPEISLGFRTSDGLKRATTKGMKSIQSGSSWSHSRTKLSSHCLKKTLVCLIQSMLVPDYVDSAKQLKLYVLPTSQFCNHEERLLSIIRSHACLSEMCPTVLCAHLYLNSSQGRIRQQHTVTPIGPWWPKGQEVYE